jgi:hypothetical protein
MWLNWKRPYSDIFIFVGVEIMYERVGFEVLLGRLWMLTLSGLERRVVRLRAGVSEESIISIFMVENYPSKKVTCSRWLFYLYITLSSHLLHAGLLLDPQNGDDTSPETSVHIGLHSAISQKKQHSLERKLLYCSFPWIEAAGIF